MSNDKKYNAQEVIGMIADRLKDVLKKNEIDSKYIEEVLKKSKNSAHEIDLGEEPKNDEAECPASLGGEGSSEKSEYSEASSMEDQPLQGDSDSDTEDEESEEEDEEDEEEKEEGFEKAEGSDLTDIKHAKEGQKKISYGERAAVTAKPREASGKNQKTAAHKVRDKKNKARKVHAETGKIDPAFGQNEATNVARNRRAEDKGIEARGKKASKKGQQRREEVRSRSSDMEKCGEMTYKSESGMFEVEYTRLEKNFGNFGSVIGGGTTDNPTIPPTPTTTAGTGTSTGGGLFNSEDEDAKVKETKGIEFDKEKDSDKTKEEKAGKKRPLEKCGEFKKKEDFVRPKGVEDLAAEKEAKGKYGRHEGSDRRKNKGNKGPAGRKVKSKEPITEKRQEKRMRGKDRLPKVPHFLKGEKSSVEKLKKFLGKPKQPSPGMVQQPQDKKEQ